MAYIDTEKDEVVLRIVYDGAAMAGKTTTLKALAASLGRDAWSGESLDGRTLYLDWLDYVGGRFDGRPIRCQVVSVPGQRALEARRRAILETADTIVFVVDSTRDRLDASIECLDVVREVIEETPSPPPRLLVQANKRDSDRAVALDEIASALRHLRPASIEPASAAEGAGVRSIFVEAVRLGLERARDLSDRGAPPGGLRSASSGEAMEALLRTQDEPNQATTPSDPVGADGAEGPGGMIALPFPEQAGGTIWPPIAGRALLHAADLESGELTRHQDGTFAVECPGWRASSPAFDLASEDAARDELLRWADWHSALDTLLSDDRCVAMVATGSGSWALWQLVRRRRTAADALGAAVACGEPSAVAEALFDSALVVATAWRLAAGSSVPPPHLGLQVLSDQATERPFVGFVPRPGTTPRRTNGDLAAHVFTELQPFLVALREASLAPVEREIMKLADDRGQSQLGKFLRTVLAKI